MKYEPNDNYLSSVFILINSFLCVLCSIFCLFISSWSWSPKDREYLPYIRVCWYPMAPATSSSSSSSPPRLLLGSITGCLGTCNMFLSSMITIQSLNLTSQSTYNSEYVMKEEYVTGQESVSQLTGTAGELPTVVPTLVTLHSAL